MPILPDDHAMTAASIVGGAASAAVNRSADTVARRIADALCGMAVGVFCGPAIADAAAVHVETQRIACAFATGAAGFLLLTLALDWIKGASFREWLGRFIGPKAPPPL
jgi:hypothetical protein